jgi:hypothetical protein
VQVGQVTHQERAVHLTEEIRHLVLLAQQLAAELEQIRVEPETVDQEEVYRTALISA